MEDSLATARGTDRTQMMEEKSQQPGAEQEWNLESAELAYGVIARYLEHTQVSGVIIALLASALGEERVKSIAASPHWQHYMASKRSIADAKQDVERLTASIERMREESRMREAAKRSEAPAMANYGVITVEELKAKQDAGEKFRLIDVRELSEHRTAKIEGSELKPLGQIAGWAPELADKDEEIVLHCHHGMRSDRACQYLAAQGFTNVKNLVGGIDEWSLKIDPLVPRY